MSRGTRDPTFSNRLRQLGAGPLLSPHFNSRSIGGAAEWLELDGAESARATQSPETRQPQNALLLAVWPNLGLTGRVLLDLFIHRRGKPEDSSQAAAMSKLSSTTHNKENNEFGIRALPTHNITADTCSVSSSSSAGATSVLQKGGFLGFRKRFSAVMH